MQGWISWNNKSYQNFKHLFWKALRLWRKGLFFETIWLVLKYSLGLKPLALDTSVGNNHVKTHV